MLVDPISKPEVLAILPTLGANLDSLLKCVTAIKTSNFKQTLSLLVIVNNPEIILEPIEGVSVVYPGMNLGFNGGLVVGSQIYQSQFIWIIQDDVFVNPNTLSSLFGDLSSNTQMSMVTPRRIDLTGKSLGSSGGWTNNLGQVTGLYSEAPNEDKSYFIPKELSWVSSAGSLIRREMWNSLGGYDLDLYPLGYGDVDFCDRATEQGYKFSVSGTATIEHNKSFSSTPPYFKHFLSLYTSAIFAEKKQKLWKESKVLSTIDPQIISKIAQRASLMLPKLTRLADAQFLEMNQKIVNLEKELLLKNLEIELITESRIWRLSEPYRLIRIKLKNLFLNHPKNEPNP